MLSWNQTYYASKILSEIWHIILTKSLMKPKEDLWTINDMKSKTVVRIVKSKGNLWTNSFMKPKAKLRIYLWTPKIVNHLIWEIQKQIEFEYDNRYHVNSMYIWSPRKFCETIYIKPKEICNQICHQDKYWVSYYEPLSFWKPKHRLEKVSI